MLLADFYMGKNDTFWEYLKHRMLGYSILRYLSASRVLISAKAPFRVIIKRMAFHYTCNIL